MRIVALAGLAAEAAAHCPIGSLTGEVTRVRDGDTIVVGRLPIRLSGIAAPEHNEPLGPEATAAMRELITGQKVRCELDGTRTHDRCAGTCFLEIDIGAELVRGGLARDGSAFSNGRCQDDEQAAAGATISTTYELPGYCRPR